MSEHNQEQVRRDHFLNGPHLNAGTVGKEMIMDAWQTHEHNYKTKNLYMYIIFVFEASPAWSGQLLVQGREENAILSMLNVLEICVHRRNGYKRQ